VKENFDRFKFALYKEKEMPEFRKWITALAGLALFAGLASAQVGPALPGNAGTAFSCTSNAAVTPTLRAEGYTEVAGDIVITCVGGPLGPSAQTGAQIPTANFTVFVNTAVTSRLLATTGGASEALLLVDEPGSNETGYGPLVPQTLCSSAAFGAGTGGCTEYVGTSNVSTASCTVVACSNVGVPVTAVGGSSPGANVFQGIVTGNQVSFFGIPVLAPSSTGERVYRITNIRVNANGISAGGATPGQVFASVSVSSSTSLTLTTSTLTVGFVQQGLSASGTLVRNASSTGNASGSGVTFNQCSSASVTSTSSTAAVGLLQYQENFGTAFKIRQQTALQNVPGTIYNSESNFVTGTNFIAPGTNNVYLPGQADYATRLKATFSNVPAGVSIYVSTRDVINSFQTPGTPTGASLAACTAGASGCGIPLAVLVVSETATDAAGTDFGSGNATQPGVPTASQTGIYTSPDASTVGIAPVAISSAGTGLAVWEVVNTNPATIDTLLFSVFINYTASPATNSPAAGSMTVTMSFAPTPSGNAFTASTGAAASNTLTIPRFSDSLDITKSFANVVICTTALLYPYVINVNGFDTGIAIANTSTDPFGTSAQAGTCSLYFYGTAQPTVNPFVTPTVATATVYANLASTLAPGFDGYMIANCNFQFAHGFAFVSDVGARNLAMGYLPLILPASRNTTPENLNN
jgi:hypothetical protein